MSSSPLVAIDLFAGGGGLTVGLKKAKILVSAAVENHSHAVTTFRANHPDVILLDRDIRKVSGAELLATSPSGAIDLLTACPPCQGFTTLTRRKNGPDPRNLLISEVTRLVTEIKPKVVMMENVPGLAKEELFQNLVVSLKELGYTVDWKVLQAADYGVPQSRRRLVLLASRYGQIGFPCPTHSSTGKNGKKKWKTLRQALKASRIPPLKLSEAKSQGGPLEFGWHIVRDITDTNRKRLAAAEPGACRSKLPEHLRPACHRGRDSGYHNFYGRLSWEQPSVTITAGCTTPSKGRFGHPDECRTISVREAALIQTFPPKYKLDVPFIDQVCQIVGNALPCDLAAALGKHVHQFLNERS